MDMKIVSVSPEWAAQVLEKQNTGNRRMRRWWSEALAASLRRGEWITTHQGIAFTKDGRLLDGQHRLHAVVLAGIAVNIAVFENVPNEAFSVIDIGVKRSIADSTGLSKKTSESCRFAAALLFGGTIVPDQVMAVAESGLAEVHDRLYLYCGSSSAYYSSAPIRLAACLLVMDGHKEDQVFELYRKLVLQHTQDMPPVGHAFSRQVNTKSIACTGAGQFDALARGLKVFHPNNRDLTKIQISDGDTAAAAAFARHIIRRSMADCYPVKEASNVTHKPPRAQSQSPHIRKERALAKSNTGLVGAPHDDPPAAPPREAVGARRSKEQWVG